MEGLGLVRLLGLFAAIVFLVYSVFLTTYNNWGLTQLWKKQLELSKDIERLEALIGLQQKDRET